MVFTGVISAQERETRPSWSPYLGRAEDDHEYDAEGMGRSRGVAPEGLTGMENIGGSSGP